MSADIYVPDSHRGIRAGIGGGFTLDRLRPGPHRLRILAFNCASLDTTVTVVAGQDLQFEFLLACTPLLVKSPQGFTDAEFAADSIGVDVAVTSSDLEATLIPDRATFHVGDHPKFHARIRNESAKTFNLVSCRGGSTQGIFPKIEFKCQGPEGGLHVQGWVSCGNTSPLRDGDFVELKPGEWFDLLDSGWVPEIYSFGTFAKPGAFVATLRYSTDMADVRRWMGMGQQVVLSDMSARLRRVPMLTLTCDTSFVVEP